MTQLSDPHAAFWLELVEVLDRGFTGSITLHCGKGRVIKYDVNEVRHPKNGGPARPEIETKRAS